MVDGGVVASHDFGACGAVGTYRSTLDATAALGAGSHEIRILITRRYGPDFTMTQYVDNVTLAPLDSTAPTITVPAPITVNATSPSGANVTYTVTATDDTDPNPLLTCTPLSGSLFPIGETTVSCVATDAAGNTGTASFKVTVEGAAEQLADLRHAVQDAGPGTSLVDKVEAAQGHTPRWRYFPSYAPPPDWVAPLVSIFTAAREQIDSEVTHENRMESNDVLRVLFDGLVGVGFVVEEGKQKAGKLPRPVFFGDEGTFLRTR
jgi:hypothetical protein